MHLIVYCTVYSYSMCCRVTLDPPMAVLKWYLPLSYAWVYIYGCIPLSILITIDGLGYRDALLSFFLPCH